MGVLDKKEPSTFKKIFGNQSGYYSLMKPKLKEELEEQTLRQKAVEIAKKMEGNYTGAVREIEKLMKGLSKDPVVATTLKRVNENLEEEVKYPHKMYDPKSGKEVEAKTPEDHEKYAKMGYTHDKSEEVKDTEKAEEENKDTQIRRLIDQIAVLKTKLENEKNKAVKPEPNPDTGEVPLTVGVAYKHFKDKAKKEVKEDVSEKTMTDKEKRLQRAKDMIKYYDAQKKAALKGKNKELAKKMLKNEADLTKKQIKMVHKVADDLPKKDFKDRYGKEKGDAVRFGTATNMVKKKLGMKEDRRLYVETIAGLKKKAEKSGMPYSILKKVYDRGMAAWKGGHRPGASQQQWAFARVNSFVTKSSGTWGGADKDLAKQVRGSK
jgi:hypothetical protein